MARGHQLPVRSLADLLRFDIFNLHFCGGFSAFSVFLQLQFRCFAGNLHELRHFSLNSISDAWVLV